MNVRDSVLILLLFSLSACAGADAALRPATAGDTASVELAFLELGIKNAVTPGGGVLVAGQPTPEQFDQLDDIGVRKVVCLRVAEEDGTGWEEARAEGSALAFVRLPVAGKDGISRDNAEAMAQEIVGVEGPVLICCGSGNRVGALFALDAYQARGADAEAALLVGRQHGLTRAEALVRPLLGLPPLTEQR